MALKFDFNKFTLFHGTSLLQAQKIYNDGMLRDMNISNFDHPKRPGRSYLTISFDRAYDYAFSVMRKHASKFRSMVEDGKMHKSWIGYPAIVCVNGKDLDNFVEVDDDYIMASILGGVASMKNKFDLTREEVKDLWILIKTIIKRETGENITTDEELENMLRLNRHDLINSILKKNNLWYVVANYIIDNLPSSIETKIACFGRKRNIDVAVIGDTKISSAIAFRISAGAFTGVGARDNAIRMSQVIINKKTTDWKNLPPYFE